MDKVSFKIAELREALDKAEKQGASMIRIDLSDSVHAKLHTIENWYTPPVFTQHFVITSDVFYAGNIKFYLGHLIRNCKQTDLKAINPKGA